MKILEMGKKKKESIKKVFQKQSNSVSGWNLAKASDLTHPSLQAPVQKGLQMASKLQWVPWRKIKTGGDSEPSN